MTTEAKWIARVKAWRASGLSATEFCEGKPYKANTLWHWSCRLGRAGVETTAGDGVGEVRLARVVRTSARPEEEGETAIVLEMGRVRVEVRRGFDPGALRGVLGVLGGAP